MFSQFRRLFIDKPLTLIHLLGGAGAATLAFLLTFNGYNTRIALPIMLICLLPDSLYTLSLIKDWRKNRLSGANLAAQLKSLWFMMGCACVLICFAAWMGSQWAILNSAFGTN